MTIYRIGKIIDPSIYLNHIREAELLGTVIHRYGEPFVVPTTPCWMTYLSTDYGETGSISFTRNTYSHPILKILVDDVISSLKNILPDIPLRRDRVHLIRTLGTIPPHRDEAGRQCCINIGLKNSNLSITKVSLNNSHEGFESNHEDHKIEDGVGYLLDTSNVHAVVGSPDIPRYIITYGFGLPFYQLKSYLDENSQDT